MVTHNLEIVAETDRVIRLAKGRIELAPDVRSPGHLPHADSPAGMLSSQL
jgi:hypothetical protein